MRTIIITDLTRFGDGNPSVCTAGTDLSTGECIRPKPYITMADCEKLTILPGAKLQGKFSKMENLTGPHQEDMSYKGLTFTGPASSDEFKAALTAQLFKSVEEGFAISLNSGQKCIQLGHQISRSIITLQIDPKSIEVVESYGKLKVHFSDGTSDFEYLPITDLGFHNFAKKHHERNDLKTLNRFIKSQEEVFLRIGLSKPFTSPQEIHGYWIQVNGIYTLPDFDSEHRSYQK